jgi:predicted nucleic acid-binding protein
MSVVVDSSVVAQRLVAEPDSPKARSLLLRWTEGSLDLLAPELLAVEIGNMLWKRALRKLLPVEKAFDLYREFQELQIPLWPSAHLIRPALRLAVRQGHPVYDCLYVALASETESELITADERLFRTFEPVLRQIRLLRDWS